MICPKFTQAEKQTCPSSHIASWKLSDGAGLCCFYGDQKTWLVPLRQSLHWGIGSVEMHSCAGTLSWPKWGTEAWRSRRSAQLPHWPGSPLMGGQWEPCALQHRGLIPGEQQPKSLIPKDFTVSFRWRLMIFLPQAAKEVDYKAWTVLV